MVISLGTYRWQESHQVADYVNWAPNQPDGGTDTNCIWKTILTNHPTYVGWHDVDCSLSEYGCSGLDGVGQIHALCQTKK